MKINDKFQGIHGIPNNIYSDMSWDDALLKIFAKLPNRTTIELETAKTIVVTECRKYNNIIENIQKFIKEYDGAIVISDNLSVMSGQQLIDELKTIIK